MSSAQETDGGRAVNWPDHLERTSATERESYPGDLSPTRKESFQSVVDDLVRLNVVLEEAIELV